MGPSFKLSKAPAADKPPGHVHRPLFLNCDPFIPVKISHQQKLISQQLLYRDSLDFQWEREEATTRAHKQFASHARESVYFSLVSTPIREKDDSVHLLRDDCATTSNYSMWQFTQTSERTMTCTTRTWMCAASDTAAWMSLETDFINTTCTQPAASPVYSVRQSCEDKDDRSGTSFRPRQGCMKVVCYPKLNLLTSCVNVQHSHATAQDARTMVLHISASATSRDLGHECIPTTLCTPLAHFDPSGHAQGRCTHDLRWKEKQL